MATHRNDGEFEWLGTQGAVGGSLPDRRYAFFQTQGIATWRDYYNANGGTGHISDWLGNLFGVFDDPTLPDNPPLDKSGNLLVKYNDITDPEWDAAGQTATYKLNGWWEYAVTDGLSTTRSLVQFCDIGNVVQGQAYEIGANFRFKGAAGTDYRLALAEYDATTWRGATTIDLDFIGVENPTEVLVRTQRTVTDATSDRIRFAIQVVNPPASGDIKIEFRQPYCIRLAGQIDSGTVEPTEVP